jgi:prepilin-type N-terminal cleavage/methylation domain-containing protein
VGNRQPDKQRIKAFTLIELLVVIAIIGILSALLLPALAMGKKKTRTVSCLNNLKELQAGSCMYPGDNNDFLPPNNFVYIFGTSTPLCGTNLSDSWCSGNTRVDLTPSNIEAGVLFPYNNSPGIYHCPADLSKVDGSPDRFRQRSYDMSQSINGDPMPAGDAPYSSMSSKITDPAGCD